MDIQEERLILADKLGRGHFIYIRVMKAFDQLEDELRAYEALKLAHTGTPSSLWAANGEPDPHCKQYECERSKLILGKLTDDAIANGVFMNYDAPLDLAGILNGTAHSPIAWVTAAKDRIRWLSRSLDKALAELDEVRRNV